MRWSDRRQGGMHGEWIAWAVVLVALCAIVVLLVSAAHAQVFYSTEEGSGLIIETLPGVRFYSGAIDGMSVELMPGVQHYEFVGPDLESRRGMSVDLSPRPMEPRRPDEHYPDLGLTREPSSRWVPAWERR